MSDQHRSGLSKTTIVAESKKAGSLDTAQVTSLVIAWSASEPERVGEIAILAQQGGPLVLGRGDEASAERRIRFFRQRPGVFEPTAPLSSQGLSRRQLLVEGTATGARIKRVGQCLLEVNGEGCEEAEIGPGDVVHLRRQLVLACVRRAAAIPAARLFEASSYGPFGEPDRLGILGESPLVWRLRETLAFAAKSDTHVLILGASGTGKELAARGIHALSNRSSRAFIARNAATLPAGLMDAELFGNAKNYPNPGMAERSGLIGEADGGTLFLDEIGELPSELQAHLLRVLDSDGEYQRLGEATVRRSKLRLVAATNRDRSSLKHDFAARFTARVDVPAIEERREDLPLLVQHLLLRAARRSPEVAGRFVTQTAAGRDLARVDPFLVVHALRRAYDANIRDLDGLLWAAMADSMGDTVELPVALREAVAPSLKEPAASSREAIAPSATRPEPSADEIRAALEASGGSIPKAATALGLSSRYVLYRLMKKHGIEGRGEDEA